MEYRFVALFPWTLVSLHALAGFNHSDFGDNWPQFIDSYAGMIVVGSTKELYLVRLRPSGKQKKQIRLDTVSLRCSCQWPDVGLNSYEQEDRHITAVAWALTRGPQLDPLLVIAMSSMICVYNVRLGKAVGFLRGHGGVCLRSLPIAIFNDFRIANFLHCCSPTSSFVHLHHVFRSDGENLRS